MSLINYPNVGCSKLFKYRTEKKRHLESGKCAGVPQEKSHLSQKIVKRDDIYLCLECNTEIKHRNNINRHKKLCENRKTKQIFSCEMCEKVFMYKSKYERHKLIHQKESFICKNCSKSFKRANHFMNHEAHCENHAPTMVNVFDETHVMSENQPTGQEFFDLASEDDLGQVIHIPEPEPEQLAPDIDQIDTNVDCNEDMFKTQP